MRRCFKEAKGDVVVMIDSGMEYPPERIPNLLDKIDGVNIVVGARHVWKNAGTSRTKLIRGVASKVYCFMIKKLFDVDGFIDIQSGFKAFRRGIIEEISPLTSNGLEIDTEILVKAVRRGFKIDTVPVTYTYKGNSKVNVKIDPFKMLIGLLMWRIKEPTSLGMRLKGKRN